MRSRNSVGSAGRIEGMKMANVSICQICPLCGNDHVVLYHDHVWSLEEGKVYRCPACDLTFIHPVMDDHAEQEFYKNYGQHTVARGVVTTSDPEELHRKGRPAALKRLGKIGKYFTGVSRVLEVGASTGAFLESLENKECYGVEPADEHRRYLAQFCKATYADLSQIPSQEKFDLICMFHVFEHIKSPLAFLEACSRHLNPGGRLIIEVPYIEDPLLTLYECGPFKNFYFQPMHPYVYSKRSLEHVFTKASFGAGEFIYYQRYGLDNHLTWLVKGKGGTDTQFASLFADDESYKQKMEKSGRTDTIFYVVRKQ
jgi:SAM-dependent methyltransferase